MPTLEMGAILHRAGECVGTTRWLLTNALHCVKDLADDDLMRRHLTIVEKIVDSNEEFPEINHNKLAAVKEVVGCATEYWSAVRVGDHIDDAEDRTLGALAQLNLDVLIYMMQA